MCGIAELRRMLDPMAMSTAVLSIREFPVVVKASRPASPGKIGGLAAADRGVQRRKDQGDERSLPGTSPAFLWGVDHRRFP